MSEHDPTSFDRRWQQGPSGQGFDYRDDYRNPPYYGGSWKTRPTGYLGHHPPPGQPGGGRDRSDPHGSMGPWDDHQSYTGTMFGMRDDSGAFGGDPPRRAFAADRWIRDEVCEELTRHPFVDATDLVVAVAQGEVTLSGKVEDRDQKRMAEACAERVGGVRDVHNRIPPRGEVAAGGWLRDGGVL